VQAELEQQTSQIKEPANGLASFRNSVDVPPIGVARRSFTGGALQPDAA
jgi:hypothetical protein